jgi:hypothetical protein
LEQEEKTNKHQHKRQQKWERQTDRDRSSGYRESKGFQKEREGGGMRSSSSSTAQEGKSTSSLAGLRYKV